MAKRTFYGGGNDGDDGGPPAAASRTKLWLRHLEWALVLAVGVVLCAPMGLKLVLQLLWRCVGESGGE